MHYGYIFPHINYAIELYRSACKTNIAKIHIVQHLLLKTLAKRNRLDSATALHRELNILKVYELLTLDVLIFVYKQRRHDLPGLFHQFYELNSEVMTRSSRQEAHLYIPTP